MTEFTPEVDLTIFPRINFLKTFGPRLEQRDLNGRVYWIDGAPGPFDDAALHLNFAESKSLIDDVSGQNLVTFTRASTATYTDNAGVIQTAAIDEARFDHTANGTSLGLLIEEARTNYVKDNDQALGIQSNITVSQVPGPDGVSTSATRMASVAAGNAIATTANSATGSVTGDNTFTVGSIGVSANSSTQFIVT